MSRWIPILLAGLVFSSPALAYQCPWRHQPGRATLQIAAEKFKAAATLARQRKLYDPFALRLELLMADLQKLADHPNDKTLFTETLHHCQTATEIFAIRTSSEAARWSLDVSLKHLEELPPDQALFASINSYQEVARLIREAEHNLGEVICNDDTMVKLTPVAEALEGLGKIMDDHTRDLIAAVKRVYKKDLRDARVSVLTDTWNCGNCPVENDIEPVKFHKGMKKNLLKALIPDFRDSMQNCCGGGAFSTLDELQAALERPGGGENQDQKCPAESAYTQLERMAVTQYTASCYSMINHALRSHDPAAIKQCGTVIDVLELALGQMPDFHGKVIRILNLSPKLVDQYKPGAIVEEAAFSSSSSDPKWSWNGNVRLHIKSLHGKSIDRFSLHSGESEVLFRPGTRFKVISRSGYDPEHIELEEVE